MTGRVAALAAERQEDERRQRALAPYLVPAPKRGIIGSSRYAERLRKQVGVCVCVCERGGVGVGEVVVDVFVCAVPCVLRLCVEGQGGAGRCNQTRRRAQGPTTRQQANSTHIHNNDRHNNNGLNRSSPPRATRRAAPCSCSASPD